MKTDRDRAHSNRGTVRDGKQGLADIHQICHPLSITRPADRISAEFRPNCRLGLSLAITAHYDKGVVNGFHASETRAIAAMFAVDTRSSMNAFVVNE